MPVVWTTVFIRVLLFCRSHPTIMGVRALGVVTYAVGVAALQEWRRTPTAVAYADGQMSGPSAYGPARPASRLTLGVSMPSA